MRREEKIEAVEKLSKLMNSYSTIGFIDLTKLPTKQFQNIKRRLEEKALIKICKKSVIKFAIRKSGRKNIAELENLIPSQPGIILTNLPTFQFYKAVDQLKSFTYAKEGDVIEKDVEIKAGLTDLLPGPVISEFAKAGIPAGVEKGKIAIKKDVIAARKGSKVTKELASILRKLNIETVEVKLNIIALYENGRIYTKDVLRLVEKYPDMLKDAFRQALNLSVAIAYPTKENIKYLLAKAYQQARFIESKIVDGSGLQMKL